MFNLESNINLAGYTLILPSVCVGNVSQFAVDLMISSLELRKVGAAWHPAILPVIGPRAFAHQNIGNADTNDITNMAITTSCELFISDDIRKLACLQLRAPLAPALLKSFFREFSQFLLSQQVAELIILSSSFAHEQRAIEAAKFLYLVSDSFRQRYTSVLADGDRWTEWIYRDGQLIHGGGFGLKLWQYIEAQKLPVCILFKYVSEGDNRSDAVQLLDRLDQLLSGRILKTNDGEVARLKVPVSWRALYGNDPTEQLY